MNAIRWVHVLAFTDGVNVVILGTPAPGDREELGPEHNCDVMGCTAAGHVVARARVTSSDGYSTGWTSRAEVDR